MEICNICGAMLVINDPNKRLETHLDGKQHRGYLRVREAYAHLEVIFTPFPFNH